MVTIVLSHRVVTGWLHADGYAPLRAARKRGDTKLCEGRPFRHAPLAAAPAILGKWLCEGRPFRHAPLAAAAARDRTRPQGRSGEIRGDQGR